MEKQGVRVTHDDDFETAWRAYPRKTAKGDARKAWGQMLRVEPDLLAKVLDALAWQRHQPQWTRDGGQYVPYFATWLRAERWTDEPFHTELPRTDTKSGRTVVNVREWVARRQGA
jgi:hypothetical protein